MEVYEYRNRKFQIEIRKVGSHYDWSFSDENMRRHNNIDGPAPSEQIALDEAQFAIRRFVNSDNG